MVRAFLGLFVFLMSSYAHAQSGASVDKFVTLKNGHKLFTSFFAPKKDFPTLVLVNGLTYSTKDYTQLAVELSDRGFGVLLYDAYGMGRTLLENPMPKEAIDYRNQIADLDELLATLKIPAPYNMVGLSYGGGILVGYGVQFPKKVNKLFLMSPYTEVIENGKNIILAQIEWHKIFFPFDNATDEELAELYTRLFAYMNYPLTEPSVLENPFKLEGVILMTQGITPFSPTEVAAKLPPKTVHMINGVYDQYVTRDVYDRFWEAAQPAQPCTYVRVNFSEHKIPQVYPAFLARWIAANYEKEYCDGKTYLANPFTDWLIDENGSVFDGFQF